MGYDPIDTNTNDSTVDKNININSINGADAESAALGEALTADGVGGFNFSVVESDALSQMQQFLSQSNISQIASSAIDVQNVIDAGLISYISASQTAMSEMVSSQTAMNTIAASAVAMNDMSSSQVAMQEISSSSIAMSEISSSQTAMQIVAQSPIAMNNISNSSTARTEILNSTTAKSEIQAVDQAIAKFIAGIVSKPAEDYPDMQTLTMDDSAMSSIAASATAMELVAASQVALNQIGNDASVQNTVYNNNTAISELNNSPLVQNVTDTVFRNQFVTVKSDTSILLSFDPGPSGSPSNEPKFGESDGVYPQTARKIVRENNTNNGNGGGGLTASFIDISG
jgi:hypothetical protein